MFKGNVDNGLPVQQKREGFSISPVGPSAYGGKINERHLNPKFLQKLCFSTNIIVKALWEVLQV